MMGFIADKLHSREDATKKLTPAQIHGTRETEEEVGVLNGSDAKPIGSLTKIYIPPSNFDVLPVVRYLDAKPDLVL